MQDSYIGDIGDYGKYGLLREICASGKSLAVNWYKVIPVKQGKQEDGKFINYLTGPEAYRQYDCELFDSLRKIVLEENDRRIERIEQEKLFPAVYYSAPLNNRSDWHLKALCETKSADTVFLDPDNGLETFVMHKSDSATKKHVKWIELKNYYERGQNVILYQHRPQFKTKKKCIEDVMYFQNKYLFADYVKLLEFSKYTNRFYFMFIHKRDIDVFDKICFSMLLKWEENNFCREINLE